jgi:hypothetical protein
MNKKAIIAAGVILAILGYLSLNMAYADPNPPISN